MHNDHANVDEIGQGQFSELAQHWWDASGRLKTLHAINPVRLAYIKQFLSLKNIHAIDIGSGGGLLSEALAREDAHVTGIDTNEQAIEIAREHARRNNIEIDYQVITPEAYVEKHPQQYDLVTCMEMLEHVPDPGAVIAACARLTGPGGHFVFSTLNRTAMAWGLAILGAEYLCRILPRGTHDYARFIRPSELNNWCRTAGIGIDDVTGMTYLPIINKASLSGNTAVNYLAHGRLSSSHD